jgi:hypothetical protein
LYVIRFAPKAPDDGKDDIPTPKRKADKASPSRDGKQTKTDQAGPARRKPRKAKG